VDCDEFREALSARLDDESWPDQGELGEEHRETCTDCAGWYEDAALITRRTRTTAAVAWPDVSDAVLARVPVTGPADTVPRIALAVTGALLGASALVSLAVPGVDQSVAGVENGAWHLALAVAFSGAAARKTPAGALLPLLCTLVAALSWGHVSGLLAGRWSVQGIATHLLIVAGLVLVALLARIPKAPRLPRPPASGANRLALPEDPAAEDTEEQNVVRLHEVA
jgi:predicted anti-sigma-YlaC factor YlaD